MICQDIDLLGSFDHCTFGVNFVYTRIGEHRLRADGCAGQESLIRVIFCGILNSSVAINGKVVIVENSAKADQEDIWVRVLYTFQQKFDRIRDKCHLNVFGYIFA